jgi:hypothetical protein
MGNKNCCERKNGDKNGLLNGLLYGIIPHTFCIGFIVFSIVGVSAATLFFKKFLLTPYLFQLLIAASFLLTTISAILYLRKSDCLCANGIKRKWKYISVLYMTTILANLLLFMVIFPALANIKSGTSLTDESGLNSLAIAVQIPCSGHAPLIIDELKKIGGVDIVRFKSPDIFEIKYNAQITSPEKIVSWDIFKTYKASIQ